LLSALDPAHPALAIRNRTQRLRMEGSENDVFRFLSYGLNQYLSKVLRRFDRYQQRYAAESRP
jgi:hypothetical protein